MNQRLKVLVNAYACNPCRGSEHAVGWGLICELAKRHDLWVLAEEEKCRVDIERYLADNPAFAERVKFHFLRKHRNRWLRKLWPPSYYWFYRRWQRDALALAHELQGKVGFDLVHQLTMVGFREPGYLWRLGIPFVWGPVGGMGLFPWRFLPRLGWYGAIYYLGYNFFNLFQMCCLFRPRRAATAAGRGLIAATRENREGARRYWGRESSVISEVGLPPAGTVLMPNTRGNDPLRVIWSGQHNPGKALDLALEALAMLPGSVAWELHVLGDGTCTAGWRKLAVALGVGERCQFHGWLGRNEALQAMASGHVMAITSLRDLTATVTIEALANGLPIVCLDHCGFGDVIDASCGLKVPVTTPAQTIQGLGHAFHALATDEALRFRLAQGALVRAQAYAWPAKAEAVEQVYARVLSDAAERQA